MNRSYSAYILGIQGVPILFRISEYFQKSKL